MSRTLTKWAKVSNMMQAQLKLKNRFKFVALLMEDHVVFSASWERSQRGSRRLILRNKHRFLERKRNSQPSWKGTYFNLFDNSVCTCRAEGWLCTMSASGCIRCALCVHYGCNMHQVYKVILPELARQYRYRVLSTFSKLLLKK